MHRTAVVPEWMAAIGAKRCRALARNLVRGAFTRGCRDRYLERDKEARSQQMIFSLTKRRRWYKSLMKEQKRLPHRDASLLPSFR